MDSTWQDLRFALRMLRKSPGFSATAILTFALGIGVNVAIFSVIDAAALRPLGVAAPDRMVRILNEDAAHPDRASFSSWIEIQRFRTESTAFAGVAGADRRAVIVKQDDEARMLLANVVSDNYFDVFQVTPAAGRTFTPAELSSASAAPLVVLSYDYWQRRYNGDSSIVGQTIVASDTVCVVLGVLPRAFRGTELFLNPDVYLPLSTWLVMNPGERVKLERPQARQIEAFGRLRAGVTPAQAAAALVPIQQQLASEYPQQESGRRIEVKFDRDTRGPQVTMIAKFLFSVAALVLMIACVNVANLLLVRGETRRQEIATRLALGARRYRTVRQLLTETVVLAVFGAAGAALFAQWVISLLPSLMPPMEFPVGFDFRIDTRVLLYGALISLVAAVIAGVLPALKASDMSLAAAIKDGGTGSGRRARWRDALVIGQVAITVVLLIASGLLVRTLIAARDLDPGFDARGNMLIARLDVRTLTLSGEHAYFRAALERLGATPGIGGAAVASRIPLWGSGGGAAVLAWVPGLPPADRDGMRVGFAVVSPNYFSTLGTRIVRGRAITQSDNESSSVVAVINESTAAMVWPNEDAIGKHFQINGPNGRDIEVIGIAQDGRYLDLTEKQRAYMFLPVFQEAQIFGSRWGAEVLVVRTTGDATAQAKTVRTVLRGIDTNVQVLSITTMDEHIRAALYGDRLMAELVGSTGVLGLVLAAIGLFGVVSFSVTRRTREIGVRIAVGAEPGDVVRLVLLRALLLAGSGIAAGVALALVGGRLLSAVLYGISARDPLTFVAAIATMAVVAIFGALIPARRAVTVDPVRALRAE